MGKRHTQNKNNNSSGGDGHRNLHHPSHKSSFLFQHRNGTEQHGLGPRIQHPQKTYARYNSSHLISHRQRIRRVDYASFRDLHDENHRNIVTRLFSDGEALRRRLDIFIEKMGQLIKTDPDEMDWEHCNQTIILEGKRSTVAGAAFNRGRGFESNQISMGATQPATFGGGTLEPPMTKVNPEVSCHTVDELPEEMEDVDKYGNAYF